jgi:hypothetical protein
MKGSGRRGARAHLVGMKRGEGRLSAAVTDTITTERGIHIATGTVRKKRKRLRRRQTFPLAPASWHAAT